MALDFSAEILFLLKTAEGKLKQILGTGTDITESKQAEDEIKLLLAATQAISQSADFHSALPDILRLLCNAIGWDFAEAWIPAANASVLEHSKTWYASDRDLDKFGRESKKIRFAPGCGSAGTDLVNPKCRMDGRYFCRQ